MMKGNLPVKYLAFHSFLQNSVWVTIIRLWKRLSTRLNVGKIKSLVLGEGYNWKKTMLSNIRNHWCSIFILPNSVIRKIESVMAAFLWIGVDQNTHKATVAWSEVYKQKQEGGLRVKNLYFWNKALVTKHIWNICEKKDSLWIKLLHSVILKGRPFWAIPIPLDCSWSWRKLLKHREFTRPLIKYSINGEDTSLWFDNWHPAGILLNMVSKPTAKRIGKNLNTKVSSIIVNNMWIWPSGKWIKEIKDLIKATPQDIFPNITRNDQIIWWSQKIGKFTVTFVYEKLNAGSNEVTWAKLV